VDPERLSRGTVILYRLSSHSAWGTAGWLVVSRILAVPGDRLSIREGQYLVNGESGPPVAETGQHAPVIQVPLAPAALTVPENCYFIVQDDPANGLDSRVLSWVEASDITSTSLYYLRASSVLKVID
jgi:signal peptidase I